MTSFQPTHHGQANSDVTYSCSRPHGGTFALDARLNGAAAVTHGCVKNSV